MPKVRVRETGASERGKLAVPSNRGGGGIFEKLQATPVSVASTRPRQKPCRCKKPAIVAGGQKVAGNFNYGAILR